MDESLSSLWMTAEAALGLLALAAAVLVRPWRMLAGSGERLVTPLLACMVLLPWAWAWPGIFALPVPLQWSGAHLAVLMLGWPLAVAVLLFSALSTMASAGASVMEALATFFWWGLLPATAALALGHGLRRWAGTHPMSYLLGRGFAIPLVSLWACAWAGAATGRLPMIPGDQTALVALLMAMGEAMLTGAAVTLLVACRPQWLATWSDALYFGPVALRPVPVNKRRR